ncbi:DNA-methyltransferase [Paraburkholderia tuberum]|uniref:Methyltransferase n=1 Tax=Paraburkholderia tuberum TaxID=157910 RepID=A0A1H1JS86_9BURK|nr:site-specific DNA-methyltransferase [Paraburkholderia tuberum]SDR52772.1 site-specific DNA-methyltransferase (adenine-specific) [Paraburkholderia tuberum]
MTPLQIGNATLFLGDCRAVMPELAAESIDMVWTDPPYGHNNADGDLLSRMDVVLRSARKTRATPIANDSPDSMREVVDGMLTQAARVLRADCCCCCCCGGGPRPTFAWLALRMDEKGLSFFHSVIWDKRNPGIGWRYRRQHEMVMVAHRAGGRLMWNEEVEAIPNVISATKPRDLYHPNEKPLRLMEQMIRAHTVPGQVVLDPFMGSGSTGVAAAKLGRRFVGIELDPVHFDTAVERMVNAHRQGALFDEPRMGAEQPSLFGEGE